MKKMVGSLVLILALTMSVATLTACSFEATASSGDEGADEATPAGQSGEAGGASDEAADNKTDGKKNSDEQRKGKDGKDEPKKEEAVPVEVAALGRGPIESVLRFSSNLEAEMEVQVVSEANRKVVQLLVEEGDKVRRNQVLLRLQDDEQRSALAKTSSQLEKAQREYERQKRLYEQELISEEVFNNATYELEQLQLALDDAQRELGYAEVRAPIGGTITSRQINRGDQIQVGQHLFDIVDFDSLVARVFVPEKSLADLREGLVTRISSQAFGSEVYAGSVKRIAPIVDPRSGTIKVTIDVGGQEGLRPGMYVDVDLVTATHDEAILIPKRALVYDNDQIYLFRLAKDNRVERIYVEAALTDKFNVEPRSGVAAGDKIVVAGQAGLKDGALVAFPEEATAGKDKEDGVDVSSNSKDQRASL